MENYSTVCQSFLGHSLRRNCLLRIIEGQITEVKGVGRGRTQLLDNLRNRRYWELKEEAEGQKGGKDSLSIELKEGIQVIFHKSTDQLISIIIIN